VPKGVRRKELELGFKLPKASMLCAENRHVNTTQLGTAHFQSTARQVKTYGRRISGTRSVTLHFASRPSMHFHLTKWRLFR
jgi:hypothetical protein